MLQATEMSVSLFVCKHINIAQVCIDEHRKLMQLWRLRYIALPLSLSYSPPLSRYPSYLFLSVCLCMSSFITDKRVLHHLLNGTRIEYSIVMHAPWHLETISRTYCQE